MTDRVFYFDIDALFFSAAEFIWLLVRNDLLVVKTALDINAATKQVETIIENFEHKLQRSLPRPEIFNVAEIESIAAIPASKPDGDPFFTKLKQLESGAVNFNCYRKNETLNVNFIAPVLINNYRNENSSTETKLSILRLNITGQGGGKYSAVFQNNNLCEIITGWFNLKFDGDVVGMLRINTNILRELLNAPDTGAAAQKALTQCQFLLTTNHCPKINIRNYANSWFEFIGQTKEKN
ncbi:MAG: hypothetical protein LBP59_01275 [Planctomycetaceae bacterium]|jgi:hypothetical protein|nr:hypothetical protein [Planctomycetaceae bacterium]